ncbi:uncharacterized protein GGS22DRAFT_153110 [Annulohypoxylon maeteangense]|uniref:uncharacterized protein n=1 Tax=Annulohypoxylon maeteangense TaxID=1927788 RepID=UPI0020084252|nr:uncharacterized protein GGS22DRAFT_153110 [Annulohypoxylon maeteangense]KAI0889090.1 hypothetical protein GGS22DRAFT_153110 [Annulohypoxylon maeteangense]
MPDSKPPPKKFDLINRGERKPTLLGTLTFVGLRLLDIPLQHALLLPTGLGVTLLSKLGITLASSTSTGSLSTGLSYLDVLGQPTNALLMLFAIGSSAKQIYWQLFVSKESFPAPAAAAVAFYNSLFNALNSLLFLALATSSVNSTPQLTVPSSLSLTGVPYALPLSTVVGVCIYTFGIILEAVSETQRRDFKDAPANAGKVCKVGVWRWSRHVNYFGYSLWRGGYTMVATGWIGGLAVGSWQMWDLGYRAAGVMDDYCTNRYKEQWAQFKREVPSKIVPGIW